MNSRKLLAAYLAACLTLAALAALPAAGAPPRRRVTWQRARQGPQTPAYATAAAAVLTASPTVAGGGYDAALAAVNGWRAMMGRPPLAWSPDLAGWAARNVIAGGNFHTVLAPGAGQVAANTGDPVAAVRMWLASPAHAAILLNATGVIGISASPGGMTANAR
jgi:uncharacterized protein YkwD